jgi:crotonobetainyl-CoA:carnitine CoA-transferase CaiB-like acyl-CoA transferase/acyl dehydratase
VTTAQPLAGIKVVEFAQMVAGPAAGLLLADYGASVIKVEPPQGDGGRHLRSAVATDLPDSPLFLAYNRNKSSIRLDLREPVDLARANALIADADVLIESSRPGVMERLGLGAETVRARHPRLVYASVSGFGASGPGARRGGVDMIIQAESGIMSTTGPAGGVPTKVGFTIVDAAAGHALCHGILAALLRRQETGLGDTVTISLYDVALHLQTGPLAELLLTGEQMDRSGNDAPLSAPAGLFRCADGSIVVSAYLPPHWSRLLKELGAEHLEEDPRFVTSKDRVSNRDVLTTLLEERFATRTASDWLERLLSAGILAGQVNDLAQVASSPLTEAGEMLGWAGTDPAVRNPVVLAGAPRGPLLALTEYAEPPLVMPAELGDPCTGPDAVVTGVRSTRHAQVPVSDFAIRFWCGAVGDRNPIYVDAAAARTAGYEGIIAPPAMMQSWVAPSLLPDAKSSPTVHAIVRAQFRRLGFTSILATDYIQDYDRPAQLGDLLSQVSWVESVSDRKQTRVGTGHFVTIAFEFSNQRKEQVGSLRVRTFYYVPRSASDSPMAVRAPSQEPPAPDDRVELAPAEIPLTRTMIIAGALASNDFEANHHDAVAARAQGLDDIIVSITTTAGLVTRYVTDQVPSTRHIRRLALRLGAPAYPGQMLTMSGHVQAADEPGLETATLVGVTTGRHVDASITITDGR